jgi:Ala-tRNA(Pro) deacylase
VFARDAKGSRHFLIIIPHDRRVDLVALAGTLSSTKLSMGSAERLERHLGVTPGAVSVFALVNDKDNAVELVIDEAIWAADEVQGHPLRNTATVSITHTSLATFLEQIGHTPRVIAVP